MRRPSLKIRITAWFALMMFVIEALVLSFLLAVNGTIVKEIETAKELGYVEAGDLTVATAGDPRMSVQLEDKVSSTNVAYVAQVR